MGGGTPFQKPFVGSGLGAEQTPQNNRPAIPHTMLALSTECLEGEGH